MKKIYKFNNSKVKKEQIVSISLNLAIALTIGLAIDKTSKKALALEYLENFKNQTEALSEFESIQKNNVISYNFDNAIHYNIAGKDLYVITNNEINHETEERLMRQYLRHTPIEDQIAYEDGVYHYDEITFEEELSSNPLEFKYVDQMLEFYSKVFELDYNVVFKTYLNVVSKNPYNWKYRNILNGTKYENKEEAIARLVYNIYSNPSDYGLSKNEVSSSSGYELNEFVTEELVYKFCDVLGVNPNIAMAIGYTESGRNLSSGLYIHRHNIGGVMGSHGFAKYKNEATGLFLFVKMLKDKYDVNIDSGNDKVNSMARRYCPDGGQWQSMVKNIKSELENNGFDYNYRRYNYEGRDLYLIGIYDPQTQVDNVSRVRSD